MLPMPRRRHAVAALCGALALVVCGTAQAWTRSLVTGANAELEVREGGALHVVLRLNVQVQGGWLSQLDVAGLEPDLELDASTPALLISSADGREHHPELSVPTPGQLRVQFKNRREAPWRGDYELRLAYTAKSPLDHAARLGTDQVSVAWQMPLWDRGLENLRVRVRAQGALEAHVDPELAHVVQVERGAEHGRNVITFTRLQLPQATPWRVRFLIPSSTPGHDSTSVAPASRAGRRAWLRFDAMAIVLATLLAAAGLTKHFTLSSVARRRHAVAVPLVPVPGAVRVFGLCAACALGAGLGASHADLALLAWATAIALCLHRGVRCAARDSDGEAPSARGVPTRGALRLQRLMELFTGRAWLDASTPVGAVLCTCALALGSALSVRGAEAALPLLAALLLVPLFVTGTRLHLPAGPGARLHRLERIRVALSLPPTLRAQIVTRGTRGKPELHIVPTPGRERSRLEVGVVLSDVEFLGCVRSVPALKVLAEPGSPEAELLARALPHARREETRNATEWLQPTGTLSADLAALLGWLDADDSAERAAA